MIHYNVRDLAEGRLLILNTENGTLWPVDVEIASDEGILNFCVAAEYCHSCSRRTLATKEINRPITVCYLGTSFERL